MLDPRHQNGLYKAERIKSSPPHAHTHNAHAYTHKGPSVETSAGRFINLYANNYLGLANHPALVSAAKQGLGQYGFSAASVRFICASAPVHNALEGFAAEVNDCRFDLAKMAARGIVNVARESLDQPVRQLGMRDGFELGLEMSGAPGAFQAMLTAMTHGGKIALLSISSDQLDLDWR
jgi:hypothetical protein